MSNGCICCTLREDLLAEVAKLAREGRFDYLLIESTGISEPMPVAETFTFEDEQGRSLSDVAQLDTMATVVDARNFLNDFGSPDALIDRRLELNADDARNVVDLLVDQVEFANVILVNKCDLVTEDERLVLVGVLRNLNPKARIVEIERGRIDPSVILGSGLFSLDEAGSQPGWLETPRGSEQPETDEYGISSFVYRARRPFDADRLWQELDGEDGLLAGVLRSKGFVWIASRHDLAYAWSQAGVSVQLQPAGYWWAAAPRDQWPEDVPENAELLAEIEAEFSGAYGDRRQELVIIGIDLDSASIASRLDACLLSDAQWAAGPKVWAGYDDPLPAVDLGDDEPWTDEAGVGRP
jgi:G3E family GTPase